MNISPDLNDPLIDRFPNISSVFSAAFNLLIGIGWGLFFVFLSITLIKIIMSAGDKFKFKAAMDSLKNIAIGFGILLIFTTFIYMIPILFTGNTGIGGVVVPPEIVPGPPPVPTEPPDPTPEDPDNDGDGWPISWDCDDTDANVYPGQTEYFQTASNGGTFDYNCNGSREKLPRFDCVGTIDPVCRTSPPPSVLNGWEDSVPNCGELLMGAVDNQWVLCNAHATDNCAGSTTTEPLIDCDAGCLSPGDICNGTPGPGIPTPDGPCLTWNVYTQYAWPDETTPWTRMPCR